MFSVIWDSLDYLGFCLSNCYVFLWQILFFSITYIRLCIWTPDRSELSIFTQFRNDGNILFVNIWNVYFILFTTRYFIFISCQMFLHAFSWVLHFKTYRILSTAWVTHLSNVSICACTVSSIWGPTCSSHSLVLALSLVKLIITLHYLFRQNHQVIRENSIFHFNLSFLLFITVSVNYT